MQTRYHTPELTTVSAMETNKHTSRACTSRIYRSFSTNSLFSSAFSTIPYLYPRIRQSNTLFTSSQATTTSARLFSANVLFAERTYLYSQRILTLLPLRRTCVQPYMDNRRLSIVEMRLCIMILEQYNVQVLSRVRN